MAANASVPVEFRTSGSIVTHVIDADGYYKLVAIGAKAADGANHRKGGRGAEIKATFRLKRGDELDILVGATSTRNVTDTGGAGGTFVVINGRQNPLIVAGGGGGTAGESKDGADASLNEAGPME